MQAYDNINKHLILDAIPWPLNKELATGVKMHIYIKFLLVALLFMFVVSCGDNSSTNIDNATTTKENSLPASYLGTWQYVRSRGGLDGRLYTRSDITSIEFTSTSYNIYNGAMLVGTYKYTWTTKETMFRQTKVFVNIDLYGNGHIEEYILDLYNQDTELSIAINAIDGGSDFFIKM